MCDLTQLQLDVEDIVWEKLSACEPFTTADISHPLIKKDASIRHHEVRAAMNRMLTDAELDAADFQTSNITVFPDGPGSQGRIARLWHPTSYDPQDYEGNKKVLIRGGSSAPMSAGTSNAFIAHRIPTTARVVLLSETCHRQLLNDTLNIPRTVVAQAGLKPLDTVKVIPAPPSLGKFDIVPCTGTKGLQKVDKEGRIRLHGTKARSFISAATAQVLVENGTKLIRLV